VEFIRFYYNKADVQQIKWRISRSQEVPKFAHLLQ